MQNFDMKRLAWKSKFYAFLYGSASIQTSSTLPDKVAQPREESPRGENTFGEYRAGEARVTGLSAQLFHTERRRQKICGGFQLFKNRNH